jgi:hypothetical protein
MKSNYFVTGFLFLILLSITSVSAQNNQKWQQWQWLLGEWKGEGNGQPGEGAGGFSFESELNTNILIRKSYATFPATANKPAFRHDDIMTIYNDAEGQPLKAIYFDNEGHTIHYSVAVGEKKIVFISEKTQNMPVFRLTYTQMDDKTVNVSFEFSKDGEHFTPYLEGKSIKIK